jgi:hypothetical protein
VTEALSRVWGVVGLKGIGAGGARLKRVWGVNVSAKLIGGVFSVSRRFGSLIWGLEGMFIVGRN